MKKYFIFSDVHSFYDELMTALDEKGFDINNPDHYVISCGDLLDRGPKSKECLIFINDLLKKGRAICIRGNHCDLMEKVICKGYFESHDYHNKTNETVYQLTNMWPDDEFFNSQNAINCMREHKLWNDYISECVDYYEVGDNVFVHGWIPTYRSYGMFADRSRPLSRIGEDWHNGDWESARWDNGMEMWDCRCGLPGKTIWCGHWHTSWGHCWLHNDSLEFNETNWGEPIEEYDSEGNKLIANFDPFIDTDSEGCGIVAMDSCCAYSHKINVKVLEI